MTLALPVATNLLALPQVPEERAPGPASDIGPSPAVTEGTMPQPREPQPQEPQIDQDAALKGVPPEPSEAPKPKKPRAAAKSKPRGVTKRGPKPPKRISPHKEALQRDREGLLLMAQKRAEMDREAAEMVAAQGNGQIFPGLMPKAPIYGAPGQLHGQYPPTPAVSHPQAYPPLPLPHLRIPTQSRDGGIIQPLPVAQHPLAGPYQNTPVPQVQQNLYT
ncbi:hypothetical protein FGADI_12582 [Fusarium gaditjirri]|uniref:Uncharacterized protein n=1 Tax=Fusarium gaditjirri TaxID=282569 RepID=A0A8H4WN57_9HYPO|nr:hypothetical protein FGADI_12582 [Fusarium gaditjirri]